MFVTALILADSLDTAAVMLKPVVQNVLMVRLKHKHAENAEARQEHAAIAHGAAGAHALEKESARQEQHAAQAPAHILLQEQHAVARSATAQETAYQ